MHILKMSCWKRVCDKNGLFWDKTARFCDEIRLVCDEIQTNWDKIKSPQGVKSERFHG